MTTNREVAGAAKDTERLTDSQGQEKTEKTKNPWKWYLEKPLQRWPFLFFIIFGCLGILWLILYAVGTSSAFILSGVCAIFMSLFGAYHFRILLGLREQVDKLSKLNKTFKAENAALTQNVNKLTKAREELNGVEVRLKSANEKLKDNLVKFQELEKNLKNLAGSNISGLQKLQESSTQMMQKWKESLIKHEKAILQKLYDQFGGLDNNPDMSEDEYYKFVAALPQAYQDKLKKLGKSFQELAKDDGLIDFEEFAKLMDEFAEQEAQGE